MMTSGVDVTIGLGGQLVHKEVNLYLSPFSSAFLKPFKVL